MPGAYALQSQRRLRRTGGQCNGQPTTPQGRGKGRPMERHISAACRPKPMHVSPNAASLPHAAPRQLPHGAAKQARWLAASRLDLVRLSQRRRDTCSPLAATGALRRWSRLQRSGSCCTGTGMPQACRGRATPAPRSTHASRPLQQRLATKRLPWLQGRSSWRMRPQALRPCREAAILAARARASGAGAQQQELVLAAGGSPGRTVCPAPPAP